MIKNTIILAFYVAAGLLTAGCGGGSGGSSQGATSSVQNISSSSASSVSSGAPVDPNSDFAAIAGVYHLTNKGDEHYLIIDNDGKITAYNYLGDGVDAGDNCYRESIQSEPNYLLNGKTVTHHVAEEKYSVAVGANEVVWTIVNGLIDRVHYNGLSAHAIYMHKQGEKIWVQSARTLESTLDVIQSSICE